MSWVRSAHHVLGVEHLLGELWDGKSTVLLGPTGGEWGEPSEEEVKTWEWDEIDSELAKVRVELTRETKTTGDARHTGGTEVVEVSVGWGGELESTEADVVQSFVIPVFSFIYFHKTS